MIKAVILDFDDTLCLTEEACFYLENETLEKMGRPHMSRELHKKTWGKDLFTAMLERSPGIDLEEFRHVFYDVVMPEHIASGRLDKIPEENLKALDKILERGKQVVILTSREKQELEHLLEPDHELASRVDTFYYKDNMRYHKPDPRAFEHIEIEHGWKAQECVYVGDSVGDAASAKGAGLHFIASLESGIRSKSDFADHPVDAFIHKFPEVVDAVEALDR